jgi:putrescine aminotransferase
LQQGTKLLDIGSQFLPSGARVSFTRELLSTLAPTLSFVHFANSGSDANEAAIRAARIATGREKIVSIRGGRHGLTGLAGQLTARALSGTLERTEGCAARQVAWDDLRAMEAALRPLDVAAVIMEPVPAALGWPLPSAGYPQSVRELCSASGALLIMDEAQTGLGRTGKVWASEHWQLVPDILVMAKGAGGGLYPLAFCAMNAQAAAWMRSHPLSMLSSFAGSDLGCLVGCEVLRITREPAFLAAVNSTAQHLSDGLGALAARFPAQIVAVRQLGLAAAVKFADPLGGVQMMSALFRHRVWAMAAAFDLSVIQIKPPLTINREQLDLLLDAMYLALVDCWGEQRVASH